MTRIAPIALACLTTLPLVASAHSHEWLGTGPDGGRIGAIVAGSTPDALLVNTLAGVFRSTDRGANWTPARGGLRLRSAGGNENTLVAAGGVIYSVGAACSMLYRSIDDGATWSPTGFDGTACIDSIAVTADATPRVLVHLGNGTLLASDDAGSTFASVGNGLPAGIRMDSITASPSTPGLVVAAVSGSGINTIYRSIDSGNT